MIVIMLALEIMCKKFFMMRKLKETVPNLDSVSLVLLLTFGYPSWIASEGHTLAQLPQSMHNSGSIEYCAPSEIAP